MNAAEAGLGAHPRTVVVLNPRAGHGRGARRWAEIEPTARSLFPELVVRPTSRAGEEVDLAASAAREGFELVIAAGGDGTASQVVDGLFRATPGANATQRPALAVLPVGTGSDWARGLGHPRDPRAALGIIKAGSLRAVDVGSVTFTAGPQARTRHWLNQSYIGVGAKVVRRVNAGSGRLGAWGYTFAAIAEARRARPVTVAFTGPSAPKGDFGLTNLVVANSRYSGGGMLTSPKADPSDGRLEFHAIGPITHGRLLRGLGRFRKGDYLELPEVTSWGGNELTVASTPGADLVEADGDVIGELPVQYRLLPSALRVVA